MDKGLEIINLENEIKSDQELWSYFVIRNVKLFILEIFM